MRQEHHASIGERDLACLRIEARDQEARERAVDPRYHVALEASAGTGKTRVLVERYLNLLKAGVDPANVLALTFTRQAAAEMRERIVSRLRESAERGEIPAARWRVLRDRLRDIAISTLDAFCLSLLREFPLEADLDPGFTVADETEVPRLVEQSLDRALRICRIRARDDEEAALVFAHLGDQKVREGLAALLARRTVVPAVMARFLAGTPPDLSLAGAVRSGAAALVDVFRSMRGGLERFIETGPPEPSFLWLAHDLRALEAAVGERRTPDAAAVQSAYARACQHFLTQTGQPRTRLRHPRAAFLSAVDYQAHRELVTRHAGAVAEARARYRRDMNLLVARGLWWMYRVAEREHRRTLDEHATVDFPDLLLRALDLLRKMDEFAQSRYRLESRYHHLLIDEFQDTSRTQWELVSLLIESWGQGAGLAFSGPLPPSVFIVGDRKQSIYGFRDADVAVLGDAARYLEGLRPGVGVRRSISRSFRAVPPLLAFINDLCGDIEKVSRHDAFTYTESDRFPVDPSARDEAGALAFVAADGAEACAEAVAYEVRRLLATGFTIRDRDTGVRRPIRPGDIALLFRNRDSHRVYEAALERRGVPAYVYKGLGFFDADEIKDLLALLRYLAEPTSDLHAAAWMRSRFVRLSDRALQALAPRLAGALLEAEAPAALALLPVDDAQALARAREAVGRWLGLVDRLPPAEVLDLVLHESAYGVEIRGPRRLQALENIKKLRALVRRVQNRGYATLPRIAAHLDRLSTGEEANAAIDAVDAVSLMTIHAAKGLEFPVVFLVDLSRGTGGRRDPIRLDTGGEAAVAVGDLLSDSGDDSIERDIEETKRLLYVALTRARDRLYLSAHLEEGRARAARGSLAEVMPQSLLECLASGGDQKTIRWVSRDGGSHLFERCRVGGETPAGEPHESRDLTSAPESDFVPVPDVERRVRDGRPSGTALATDGTGRRLARLCGTAVHRLLQRIGFRGDLPDELLRSALLEVVRTDEWLDVPDRAGFSEQALSLYRRLCNHPLVQPLQHAGVVLFELPFVMEDDGVPVQGTIDCVLEQEDRLLVLEFKTGLPRREHASQVDRYRAAARALFPGVSVDVQVVYADEWQVQGHRKPGVGPDGLT